MSKEDAYFQFPLSLLALPPDLSIEAEDRWASHLRWIVGYCLCEQMKRERARSDDKRFELAAKTLDVSNARLERSRNLHRSAADFLSRTPAAGRDALVRIKVDYLWDSVRGGITEMEFKVLCAIYSAIGSAPLKQIERPAIQGRAAGCVSPRIFNTWQDRGTVYTTRQIDRAVLRLERKGFFARQTVLNRFTFYSVRMSPEQLGASLLDRFTKARRTSEKRAERSSALDAAIRSAAGQSGQVAVTSRLPIIENTEKHDTAVNYNTQDVGCLT